MTTNREVSIFSTMSALSRKHNAINLGQGFPNFDCDPILKDLVNGYLQKGMNQYCAMPGLLELRTQISNKLKRLYDVDINPESEITITSGATQAIFTIVMSIVNIGDEVLIIDPSFDSYRPTIEIAKAKAISCKLRHPDYTIDWSEFKSKISEKTKLIIINSPQNPTGQTFTKEDMQTLESIVENKELYILSDEVYEHLVYDKQTHETILKYPALYSKSFAVFSFGKTFHTTGWKIGYCIAPPQLTELFRNVHQWNVFSVNTFIQHGLAEYLKDPKSYDGLSNFYQEKRDLFQNLMAQTKLKPIDCKGTYFQLYDYSEISNHDDITFAKNLVINHGVTSIPISPLFENRDQNRVLRFCFAKTKQTLIAAAERLGNL